MDNSAPSYSTPPDNQNVPLKVDIRLNIDKIDTIDTAQETATLAGTLILTWTDPRLINWDGDLPPTLWGPWMRLANALDDGALQQVEFELIDSSSGRLKRGIRIFTRVSYPMEGLALFPFDTATLALRFLNFSHWQTLDGLSSGTVNKGRAYHVQEVWRESEGAFCKLNWNGRIREWDILGYNYLIDEKEPNAAGCAVTIVTFNVRG